MSENALAIAIPLRSDFTAQMILPYLITLDEVDRLCALLRTLPIPAVGAGGSHDGRSDT